MNGTALLPGWLRPELFPGIGVLPGPATESHIVNRGTPVAPLGQPSRSWDPVEPVSITKKHTISVIARLRTVVKSCFFSLGKLQMRHGIFHFWSKETRVHDSGAKWDKNFQNPSNWSKETRVHDSGAKWDKNFQNSSNSKVTRIPVSHRQVRFYMKLTWPISGQQVRSVINPWFYLPVRSGQIQVRSKNRALDE